MIDCYTWKTGNGRKVLLMLAECGLPCNTVLRESTRSVFPVLTAPGL